VNTESITSSLIIGIMLAPHTISTTINPVMYLCLKGIDLTSFSDVSIGYWNCSDSVLFCACHCHFICIGMVHGIYINPATIVFYVGWCYT